MIELFLKFKDPGGEDRRVAVDKERFAVGRHSENDLSIADGRLSREHLRIERFGDVFVVSELGSSNGTTLNGETLTDPVALKNGDKLSLGGLEIKVEIASDEPNAVADPPNHAEAKKWLDDYDPDMFDELPIKYALGRIANQRNAAKARLATKKPSVTTG